MADNAARRKQFKEHIANQELATRLNVPADMALEIEEAMAYTGAEAPPPSLDRIVTASSTKRPTRPVRIVHRPYYDYFTGRVDTARMYWHEPIAEGDGEESHRMKQHPVLRAVLSERIDPWDEQPIVPRPRKGEEGYNSMEEVD